MLSRDHSPFSRQKPPPGCQIDWGHPLSRGLVAAWVFNEAQSSTFFNLVTHDKALFAANLGSQATAQWRYGPSGAVQQCATNGFGPWLTAPPPGDLMPAKQVSMFWRGQILGNFTGTNNVAMAAMWFNNAGTTPFVSYGLHRRLGDQTKISYFTNGPTFAEYAYSGAIDTGYAEGTVSFLSTYDHLSAHRLFKNGKLFGSNAVSTGVITYGATPTLTIGTHITASESANINNDVLYIWNRALSGRDAQDLNAEPFAMLRGPGSRRSFGKAAA